MRWACSNCLRRSANNYFINTKWGNVRFYTRNTNKIREIYPWILQTTSVARLLHPVELAMGDYIQSTFVRFGASTLCLYSSAIFLLSCVPLHLFCHHCLSTLLTLLVALTTRSSPDYSVPMPVFKFSGRVSPAPAILINYRQLPIRLHPNVFTCKRNTVVVWTPYHWLALTHSQ